MFAERRTKLSMICSLTDAAGESLRSDAAKDECILAAPKIRIAHVQFRIIFARIRCSRSALSVKKFAIHRSRQEFAVRVSQEFP